MKQGQTVIIDPLAPNRHRLMVQEALEVLERLGCKPQHTQPAEATRSRRGLLGRVMLYLLHLLAPLVYFFYGNPEKNQAHNAQTQLLCLPPEILFHVLGFLSARDLAIVQLSCSDLAHHAGDDRLWRQLCKRDWAMGENMLAEYLGVNWCWVYRSKVVILSVKSPRGTYIYRKHYRWDGYCGLEGCGLDVGRNHVMEGLWECGHLVFGRGWACYYERPKHKSDFHVGCSTGYKYEGGWQKMIWHGQGTFYWRNGASWQGTFNHGNCPATGEIISDVRWSSRCDCCHSRPEAIVHIQREMRRTSSKYFLL